VTTDYDLFKLQFQAEVSSFSKLIQAKEKLLEALEAKITGYISSTTSNKTTCLSSLLNNFESLKFNLNSRYETLKSEIESLSDQILKPLNSNLERIRSYLQESQSLINNAERISEKLTKNLLKDPLQISNELKKININNFHYIDTFIKVTKASLDTQSPKIPVAELNLLKLEECLFLDYSSKLLETKPLFPYWNLDRLLNSLKIKDQGSTISSKSDTWSTALFKEGFTCGQVSIEFLIQKDASGQKLYIGMIQSNSPGLNLGKSLSSTSGHSLWAYRICGEMHSKGFVFNKHKDKRRYRRGDKVKIIADLERNLITFYKNGIEMYSFTDIADTLLPFVCFGEAFQSVQILTCDYNDPKVVFH
jgi:hypothetical protein